MFTPNKLIYPQCPYCKMTLNTMSWVPMDALANGHYVCANCPACDKQLEVRVHVTFKVEVFKAE